MRLIEEFLARSAFQIPGIFLEKRIINIIHRLSFVNFFHTTILDVPIEVVQPAEYIGKLTAPALVRHLEASLTHQSLGDPNFNGHRQKRVKVKNSTAANDLETVRDLVTDIFLQNGVFSKHVPLLAIEDYGQQPASSPLSRLEIPISTRPSTTADPATHFRQIAEQSCPCGMKKIPEWSQPLLPLHTVPSEPGSRSAHPGAK